MCECVNAWIWKSSTMRHTKINPGDTQKHGIGINRGSNKKKQQRSVTICLNSMFYVQTKYKPNNQIEKHHTRKSQWWSIKLWLPPSFLYTNKRDTKNCTKFWLKCNFNAKPIYLLMLFIYLNKKRVIFAIKLIYFVFNEFYFFFSFKTKVHAQKKNTNINK